MSARRWSVYFDEDDRVWLAEPNGECTSGCPCEAFPTHAEAIAYATTQARTEQEPCS